PSSSTPCVATEIQAHAPPGIAQRHGPKGRGAAQSGDSQENAKFFQKKFGIPNISSTFVSESDITINNIAYEKFNNRFN
ncbi:MAG: hypothetical protein IKX28_03895, partial [Bacteroidales bacterium]|nr:hypothetical protein [Bacteroidales bacterium]